MPSIGGGFWLLVLLVYAIYAVLGVGVCALFVQAARYISRVVRKETRTQDNVTKAAIYCGLATAVLLGLFLGTTEERGLKGDIEEVAELSVLTGFGNPTFAPARWANCATSHISVYTPADWRSARYRSINGAELHALEVVTLDADRFEAEGWSVVRYAPTTPRTLVHPPSSWMFIAQKGDRTIRSSAGHYHLLSDGCDPSVSNWFPGLEEVPEFQRLTIDFSSTSELEAAQNEMASYVSQAGADISRSEDEQFDFGLGSETLCPTLTFHIRTHELAISPTDLVANLAHEMEEDGWKVVRQQADTRFVGRLFVAERDSEFVYAESPLTGEYIDLRRYKGGCADWLPVQQSMELVSEFVPFES